jgi:hypothetical protein
MQKYAFGFTYFFDKVLLIRKRMGGLIGSRPSWQIKDLGSMLGNSVTVLAMKMHYFI